ncbi:MRN complex-interacting protein [Sesbania bispinosa]|nr:MRN complex-interacting protein [Sesbania bispinosa]
MAHWKNEDGSLSHWNIDDNEDGQQKGKMKQLYELKMNLHQQFNTSALVKQRKKSSNKWSCAVCNQKQSVRKVFAQGHMASDIRKFVQSFNMSRKSLDDAEWLLHGTLDPPPENCQGQHEFPANRKTKRSDWTEYLQQEDHHEQEQNGDDFEPLVVTELHKGMFKERRVVDNSTARSDRVLKNPHFANSQEEPMKDQRRITLTESNSERDKTEVTPDNQRTKKCKPTISRAASKWNDYLTEDNDNLELGWKRGINFKDHSIPWNNCVLEAITSEKSVEDDIHPDFL